jgi:hypothetical protein
MAGRNGTKKIGGNPTYEIIRDEVEVSSRLLIDLDLRFVSTLVLMNPYHWRYCHHTNKYLSNDLMGKAA